MYSCGTLIEYYLCYSQVVQVVLDGIHNMIKMWVEDEQNDTVCQEIERCGGLDAIELLQSHENVEIYKLAYAIIDKYFSSEDDDLQTTDQQEGGEAAGFQFDESSISSKPSFNFQ